MPTELIGRNFQSWEEFEVTVDGVTVVVGPSNIGKSAIYRALKGLVRNLLNAGQIRVGSEGLEVEATIDGHKIVARRPKKKTGSVSYEVDGESYGKLQLAVPAPIEAMNLGEIEIGNVKLDPIFAGQFGTQFMLERTPQEMNTILGAFSSTERLEQGKRVAISRIGEQNAQAKALAIEARETAERIGRLEPLVEKANAIQKEVDGLEPETRRLEGVVEDTATLIVRTESLNVLTSLLDRMIVPETTATSHGIKLVDMLTLAEKSLTVYNRSKSAQDRLIVPDTAKVDNLLRRGQFAGQAALAKITAERGDASLNMIAEVVVIWTAIASATGLFKQVQGIDAAIKALNARDHSPAAETLASLDKKVVKINDLLTAGNDTVKRIQLIEALIKSRNTLDQKMNEGIQNTTNWKTAQEKEQEVRSAWDTHKLEHSAGHGKTCPKCGTLVEV